MKQDKRYLNLTEKYMDGGEIFRKYWEMGDARSFKKLQKYIEHKTGTQPTHMGVWKSMWRWASMKENRDEAWAIYSKWNPDDSFEKWISLLVKNIRIAWQFTTDFKLKNFYKNNGYKVKYLVVYSDGREVKFDDYTKAYYEWYNFGGHRLETFAEVIK